MISFPPQSARSDPIDITVLTRVNSTELIQCKMGGQDTVDVVIKNQTIQVIRGLRMSVKKMRPSRQTVLNQFSVLPLRVLVRRCELFALGIPFPTHRILLPRLRIRQPHHSKDLLNQTEVNSEKF